MEETVPVITANFNPLRFVLRGDSDVWNPTLEQINGRDYDYVKLHRLSAYFDVGIAPFSMGVCFDGTLVLPSIPKFRDPNNALAQFNETLTELLVGGVYCEAVTPDDLGYGSLSFTAYARIHGGGVGPAASFHKAARTKHIGTLDAINLLHPETITVDELEFALKSGRELLSNLGDIPREQVLYGTTFYVRKQWAESLIHIWTTTERVVELAWQKYVVGSVGVPSKKRRAFLDDHRTWTVSTKLEVLFQKKLLPSDTYEKLDDVRKARNNFAHRGVVPTYEIASLGLSGCFELASLCSSSFERVDLFNKVVELVTARCNPDLFPKKTKFKTSEVSHWLPLPPLPGDKEWGDKEYEIVEDLCLKPLDSSL
jgi:hypothetical protein